MPAFTPGGGLPASARTAGRRVECWNCGQRGHYKNQCPRLDMGGAAQVGGHGGDRTKDRSGGRAGGHGGGVMHTYAMGATDGAWPADTWVVDSGAGHHITGNKHLLNNAAAARGSTG